MKHSSNVSLLKFRPQQSIAGKFYSDRRERFFQITKKKQNKNKNIETQNTGFLLFFNKFSNSSNFSDNLAWNLRSKNRCSLEKTYQQN